MLNLPRYYGSKNLFLERHDFKAQKISIKLTMISNDVMDKETHILMQNHASLLALKSVKHLEIPKTFMDTRWLPKTRSFRRIYFNFFFSIFFWEPWLYIIPIGNLILWELWLYIYQNWVFDFSFLMIMVINFDTWIDTRRGLGAQFLMPTPLRVVTEIFEKTRFTKALKKRLTN